MAFARSSTMIAPFAAALACGCFALFSLDEHGPGGAEITDASSDVPTVDASDAGPRPRIVFVTSERFMGSVGGAAGADNRCNALAADAGIAGAFVAWISDGANGAASRVGDPGRAIVLANGAPVASSLPDLAARGPRTPIVVDEKKAPLAGSACGGAHVWTNARGDGTLPDGGVDCMSWGGVLGGGFAGRLGGVADDWTTGCSVMPCDRPGHLYCFQK